MDIITGFTIAVSEERRMWSYRNTRQLSRSGDVSGIAITANAAPSPRRHKIIGSPNCARQSIETEETTNYLSRWGTQSSSSGNVKQQDPNNSRSSWMYWLGAHCCSSQSDFHSKVTKQCCDFSFR
jgi:hypothetical protein